MLAALTGESKGRRMYQDMKQRTPYIFGKVIDFTPRIEELNVWTNNELDDTAGNQLNYYIDNIKRKLDEPAVKMITSFFNNGLPMIPFPRVEGCLGLVPKDSHLEIKEGYAVLAFDYDVEKSNQQCLFNMKDQLSNKERGLLEEERSRLGRDGKTLDITEFAVWAQNAAEKVGNIGLPADIMKEVSSVVNDKGFDGIKDALGNLEIK